MDTPQFKTAEYSGAKGGDACQICKQPVGATYYRVGKAMACESCAEKAKRDAPTDSHSAFARGMLFGIGGAIVGLAIYAIFAIATGLVIGYVSLAVGYIVGKAMMYGSKGFGGRRYQIAAIILTYAAVSLAAIPIGITQYVKQRDALKEAAATRMSQPKNSSPTVTTPQPDSSGQQGDSADQDDSSTDSAPARHTSFGSAIGSLLLMGLASPFLELKDMSYSGIIGIVILFVGMRFAWRITAGNPVSQVSGPFLNKPPASAPPSLG